MRSASRWPTASIRLRSAREQGVERRSAAGRAFKTIALEWLEKTSTARKWTADHTERVRCRFETHFFPWLGHKDIQEVTDDAILACIRRIEDRNLLDTAHRALSEVDALCRFAKRRKYTKHNVVAEVRGPDTLPRVKVTHHAAIVDPAELAPRLRAIDAYPGAFAVRCALRFLPLVFVRPGELRWSTWSEFDFDGAEWRIPAERIKMREYHIVPLSRQALEILTELRPLTGDRTGYVFPQVRNPSRPISENTINVALRSIGYAKDQQTGHGFRRIASTLLNEQGFNPDAIERQLAHGDRDEIRGVYNAAQYLPERRKMMQEWADYLDGLKASTNKGKM
jgi:integrase